MTKNQSPIAHQANAFQPYLCRLLRICFLALLCISYPAASMVSGKTNTPPQTTTQHVTAKKPQHGVVNEKLGRAGRYRVSIRSRTLPVPLRRFHQWIVRIVTPHGGPAMPALIQVDGGMPDHGHAFPSRPRVTQRLGGGDFLIEGVKFNMAGRWKIAFRIDGREGPDAVSFYLDIHDVPHTARHWGDSEKRLLASMTLDALPPVPGDASNRVSQDPRAAAIGKKLFFDKGLSATGDVSCASCHAPGQYFSDGRRVSTGLGESARHAPGLLGVGYGSWFYWDGRRDSLWAQALTPLEAPEEMGSTRVEVVRHVLEDLQYGPSYEAIFGPRPSLNHLPLRAGPLADEDAKAAWWKLPRTSRHVVETAFANIGKLIAAFERELVPGPSRFDRYVSTLLEQGEDSARKVLTENELAGLKLFVDDRRTQCMRCHNGPLFTNYGFHNIGTGKLRGAQLDFGREVGVHAALLDPFNCAGSHNDGRKADCNDLRFLQRDPHAAGDLRGAFKVPTLRNVARTAPYLHDGRHRTLETVLEHYRTPPDPSMTRHELARTALSDLEARQLVAFLGTLTEECPAPCVSAAPTKVATTRPLNRRTQIPSVEVYADANTPHQCKSTPDAKP